MEHVKNVGDVVSVGTVVATLIGWLPHISALLTVVWLGIRIYETDTVQGWLNKPKGESDGTNT